MSENNKIQEIIKESLENIRSIIDANTVIGTPMETSNGVTIIPVSKVSVGFASGGLDFEAKRKLPPRISAVAAARVFPYSPLVFWSSPTRVALK